MTSLFETCRVLLDMNSIFIDRLINGPFKYNLLQHLIRPWSQYLLSNLSKRIFHSKPNIFRDRVFLEEDIYSSQYLGNSTILFNVKDVKWGFNDNKSAFELWLISCWNYSWKINSDTWSIILSNNSSSSDKWNFGYQTVTCLLQK